VKTRFVRRKTNALRCKRRFQSRFGDNMLRPRGVCIKEESTMVVGAVKHQEGLRVVGGRRLNAMEGDEVGRSAVMGGSRTNVDGVVPA